MTDTEPNGSIRIPIAWIGKYVLPALLSLLAAKGIIEPEVARVKTGAVNRTEENAAEITYLLQREAYLTAEVRALNTLLEQKP